MDFDFLIKKIEKEAQFLPQNALLKKLFLLLENEIYGEIKFDRLPFCIVPEGIDHFRNEKDKLKIKKAECLSCKLNLWCNGFYPEYSKIISNVPDLPKEIIIEVTDKCNAKCEYCFNDLEYKLNGRNQRKEMNAKEIKQIIAKIKDFGVNYIRFSGGEPLLRKDIFQLMRYAKSLKMKVWLNTNGTLVNEKNSKIILKYASNILMPLNGYDEESDSRVTKIKGSFRLKMRAISLLRNVQVIRCGIVITKQNAENLEAFYKIAEKNKITFIEFYRPIVQSEKKAYLKKAIDAIYQLNLKHGKNYKVANAFPFCFYKPEITSRIALGGIYDDGYSRMVISSNGEIKPSYYFMQTFGNVKKDSFYSIWNNDLFKKLRNLDFTPKKCKECSYILTCRAASRSLALLNGNISGRDPLMPDF
jgi:radical SAM protein with 4Fe4S-binding SPASM domain